MPPASGDAEDDRTSKVTWLAQRRLELEQRQHSSKRTRETPPIAPAAAGRTRDSDGVGEAGASAATSASMVEPGQIMFTLEASTTATAPSAAAPARIKSRAAPQPPPPVPLTPLLDHLLRGYAATVTARLERAEHRGLRFPRAPLERIWPIVREALVVLCATVLLVRLVPPAFETLPRPFRVDASDTPLEQARAALIGAGTMAGAFFVNFGLYGVFYVYRWNRLLYCHIACLVGSSFGIPFYLFLVRAAQGANVPLDSVTLALATCNFVVPGVLLVQWAPTSKSCWHGRRCYAAALSTLCSWLLASMSSPTLVAVLGLFALIDVLLVALPCCSPVQTLDKLTWQRVASGEPHMPGLTFHDPARDGLLLGLGDFIVFSGRRLGRRLGRRRRSHPTALGCCSPPSAPLLFARRPAAITPPANHMHLHTAAPSHARELSSSRASPRVQSLWRMPCKEASRPLPRPLWALCTGSARPCCTSL